MDALARAARIKLIAFDIDGVMTDGGLHYSEIGRASCRERVS
jgi:3-deoxy-D-manno-octulosonate 8-phosphate phosphatase (KDO 8-P phosphatase)